MQWAGCDAGGFLAVHGRARPGGYRSPGWFMGQTPQMSSAVCHRAECPEPLRVKSCMKRKIPSSRVLFSNTNDLLLKDVVTMCLNFLNVAHGFFLPPFFFFFLLCYLSGQWYKTKCVIENFWLVASDLNETLAESIFLLLQGNDCKAGDFSPTVLNVFCVQIRAARW